MSPLFITARKQIIEGFERQNTFTRHSSASARLQALVVSHTSLIEVLSGLHFDVHYMGSLTVCTGFAPKQTPPWSNYTNTLALADWTSSGPYRPSSRPVVREERKPRI